MITCRVNFEPLNVEVDCTQGTLLSEVLREAGVDLVSVCGGKGLCGRCLVRVIAGGVPHLTGVEQERLSPDEIADGFRLACQLRVLDNIQVSVSSTSLLISQRLQLAGAEVEVAFEPVVKECFVALVPAIIGDSRSDWERIVEELKNTHRQRVIVADLFVLRSLPSLLRGNNWKVRVSIRHGEVIDVRPPDQTPLGLAVDLGTTKIAAYLVDLETGRTLAAEGIMNPQIAYGEDVISRISYAMEQGNTTLQKIVVEGLNGLVEKLCPEPERILEITLVGNTAMHHLFLGLPVKQLGVAPYLPAVQASLDVKARDLGLHTAPGAYVHVLPNVAGFIGADHTAMILSTGIYKTDKTVIGLDIGTNTEIVLAHRGKLMSTSCASGPAFEGGHLTCGMRAGRGAVEKITIQGPHVTVQTIDDSPPLGLCGSGVLDAIAELCRSGLINRQGRLGSGPGVRQVGTAREFVLVAGERSGTGKDITITQKDIGEIQLAKAAIRTGIEALLSEMKISWEEIEEVIIAGGFGTAINPASAIAIGMFPPLPLERFKEVGNAAGTGARLALISRPQRAKAEEIARQISYLELMTRPDFSNLFASFLLFPDKTSS
jgi:uncharacterized 2Fe-2S/4Fe-4S cluster protein (DUF4445 family)